MSLTPTRRGLLQGGAALLGLAVSGAPLAALAAGEKSSITLRIAEDLSNLDPANRTGPTDLNVIWAVQQGLISFKPGSTEWQLDAAEEITQVSDTEITFKLREGLSFTDGYGPLTAEDVKFSFERFINAPEGKAVTYASDWAALDRVEVTGELTGRILLKDAAPALWTITLPDGSGRIISKKAYEELGDKISTRLIGSGPYVLKEWTPRERFVLALNPDYKGPIEATFEEIIGKPIAEQKTAEIAFQTGEIDFTAIAPESRATLEGVEGVSFTDLPGIDYVWFGPNIAKAPFDDIRVRQAIRYAVDIDGILAGAYSGIYPRANSLLAPGLLGHWAEAPVYARDVEKAKALLAEAGLTSLQARLTILADARFQAIAQIIQANLAEAGIEIEIEALEGASFWALGENDASKDLDLSLVIFRGKFDPSFQTQWFTSDQIGKWNWQRFSSPEFDQLHAEGAKTTDPEKRREIYIKAQQLLDESAAFNWITHNLNSFASRGGLVPGVLPNGNNWLYPAFTRA